MRSRLNEDQVRSSLFGVEDSLVSTTGLIAGIGAGAGDRDLVVLVALVAIAVEALSMGSGEFLSERTAQQMEGPERHPSPAKGALIMFGSYLFAGFIPLWPILVIDFPLSLAVSVATSLAGLFLLGYLKGRVVHRPAGRSGAEVLVVGGLATLIGVLVGLVFKI